MLQYEILTDMLVDSFAVFDKLFEPESLLFFVYLVLFELSLGEDQQFFVISSVVEECKCIIVHLVLKEHI